MINCNVYLVDCEEELVDKSEYVENSLNTGVMSMKFLNTDMVRPVIVISSQYANANYVWIDAPYNRWYFVKYAEGESGEQVVLHLECDVLFTYKDYIKNIEARCIRSENGGVPTLIRDDSYPVGSKVNIYTNVYGDNINQTNLLDDQWFILNTK